MEFQTGWYWCFKCAGLVLVAGGGVCADGLDHDTRGAGPYRVAYGPLDPGLQDQWSHCWKCGCLFHWRFNEGICHDGQAHDRRSSIPYGVYLGAYPDGGSEDSLWCSHCQRLFRLRDSNSVCSDGQPHNPHDSGPYSVSFDPQPIPPEPSRTTPPPADPTIEVSESSHDIVVTGAGFTPGVEVSLVFLRGPMEKRVAQRAGDDGTFEHVEQPTVRAEGSIVIIGRDTFRNRAGTAKAVKRMPPELQDDVIIDHGGPPSQARGCNNVVVRRPVTRRRSIVAQGTRVGNRWWSRSLRTSSAGGTLVPPA